MKKIKKVIEQFPKDYPHTLVYGKEYWIYHPVTGKKLIFKAQDGFVITIDNRPPK